MGYDGAQSGEFWNAIWRTFAFNVLVALHEAELLDVSDAETLPFLERVSVSVVIRQTKKGTALDALATR